MIENNISFEDLKLRLTPAQRKAAELIVANDFAPKKQRKTLGEIAKEVGISDRQLYTWRQNPDFTRYVAASSDGELSNYRSLADSQLIKLIKGTSNNGLPALRALELFYKLEGRLQDKRTVTFDDVSGGKKLSRSDISKELEKLEDYIQ